MINNSNNGMYLETIINNTAIFYKKNKTCLLFKRNVPIKIIKNNQVNIIGKIVEKSESDFYGVYKGLYFDFEAKQTNKDVFYLTYLKEHQFNHLILVDELKGISFLLIYFSKYDEFYAIPTKQLIDWNKNITREWCKKIAFELKLFFPGILNIETYLNTQINTSIDS